MFPLPQEKATRENKNDYKFSTPQAPKNTPTKPLRGTFEKLRELAPNIQRRLTNETARRAVGTFKSGKIIVKEGTRGTFGYL